MFTDDGLISQNCAVEVEGFHYCFGASDLYRHDGTTKQSICDERVKNFVFQNLNTNKANVCFVQHNPNLNEIYFCYLSADADVAFPNATRCNRAAAYNYRNNTWSFYDLPNVSSGTTANVNSVTTYATATGLTYDTIGGSFFDQEDNYDRHALMVGEDQSTDGITSDKLYGIDLSDEGKMSFAVDTEATKPPLLERTGLDLDEAGSAATNYTVVTGCIHRQTPPIHLTPRSLLNLVHQISRETPRHIHLLSRSMWLLITRSIQEQPAGISATK